MFNNLPREVFVSKWRMTRRLLSQARDLQEPLNPLWLFVAQHPFLANGRLASAFRLRPTNSPRR